jgi:NAD(P)-dependent dehydrogenase (short-subunit alcohol dehydrogenase family)
VGEDLVGKVAVVTGGSKGIGLAIATELARGGAAVMLSSRKQEALDVAAVAIRHAVPGARVAAYAANAGEPDQAEACVQAAIQELGALDILVNNAATNPTMGPIIDTELSAWDKTFRVNVRGTFVWTQLAWRVWMRDHGGAVVNLASVGGLKGVSGIGVYDTTKAAVVHLTRILAIELGPAVRVNCIAPGLVETDFSRALWEADGAEHIARLPLARLGTPEDVAAAARFLASDQASWITGHTLVVDGGALAGSTRTEF